MSDAKFELYTAKGNLLADLNTKFMKKLGSFTDNCLDANGSFTDERLIGRSVWWLHYRVVKTTDKTKFYYPKSVVGGGYYIYVHVYPAPIGYDEATGTFSWQGLRLTNGIPGAHFGVKSGNGEYVYFGMVNCSSEWIYGYYE